jgi:hypothetical protein
VAKTGGRGAGRVGTAWIGTAVTWIIRMLIGIVAFVVILFTAYYAGVGWAVHIGLGQRGTFVEASKSCGRNNCLWEGNFVPDDGGTILQDVQLENGGGATGPAGGQVPATFAFGLAYPDGGGPDVVTYTLALVAEVAALSAAGVYWNRWRRRVRADARRTHPVSGP